MNDYSLPVLLLILTIPFLSSHMSPAISDSVAPTYQVGYWWKYHIQASLPMNFSEDDTYTVQWKEADKYDVTFSSLGNFTTDAQNTITGSGIVHFRSSDLAYVDERDTFTTSYWTGLQVTRIVSIAASDPEPVYRFPLIIGNTWTYLGVEQQNVTTFSNSAPRPVSTTDTTTENETYAVVSFQNTTVPAGRFETALLRDKTYNATGLESATDDYYSSQVGSDVKFVNYDAKGDTVSMVTLTSYSLSSNTLLFVSQLLERNIYAVIGGIAAFIVLALVIYLMRGPKATRHQSSTSITPDKSSLDVFLTNHCRHAT